jgi:hypothetical protein
MWEASTGRGGAMTAPMPPAPPLAGAPDPAPRRGTTAAWIAATRPNCTVLKITARRTSTPNTASRKGEAAGEGGGGGTRVRRREHYPLAPLPPQAPARAHADAHHTYDHIRTCTHLHTGTLSRHTRPGHPPQPLSSTPFHKLSLGPCPHTTTTRTVAPSGDVHAVQAFKTSGHGTARAVRQRAVQQSQRTGWRSKAPY